MEAVFVICGVDGSGKTTITKKINDLSGFLAIERGDTSSKPYGLNPRLLDALTLQYTFDDRSNVEIVEFVDIEDRSVPVYWLVLDAHIDELEKRLDEREMRDVWESTKALFYYQKRFRELAGYFGLPIINTTGKTVDEVVKQILDIPKWYAQIRRFRLENLDVDTVMSFDIENYINHDCLPSFNMVDDLFSGLFTNMQTDLNFIFSNTEKQRIIQSRYMVNGGQIDVDECEVISVSHPKSPQVFQWYGGPLLKLVSEGESKKVYKILTNNPYLKDVAIIILKPTIYSHSKQATGTIEGLSEIRAKGTKIFLEMMWRNGINHTYRSINNHGVILSDYLKEVPITEIVVKRSCEGTDKYSYYDMRSMSDLVLETGEYKTGPYVRFDWRNPNHICESDRLNVNENIYYYLIEEMMGKETFFEKFLRPAITIPFGDKSVSEDLVRPLIDTDQTRKTVLKLFFTIQHYFRCVGLEIIDVCFMLDKDGNTVWSEVNEDCMRIKTVDGSVGYDKDIWRSGGSSSKNRIVEKWETFNNIMETLFRNISFHESDMTEANVYSYQKEMSMLLSDDRLNIPPFYKKIYQDMARGYGKKRVIVTMDMFEGLPVLVKSGKVFKVHSDGNYKKAMKKIGLFPDILVVDLDGAFGKTGANTINRKIIKELATKCYIHSGGGLRCIEDVQDVLGSSARRIVISSNTDEEFIKRLPKERLIVELSVDGQNNVMIHGRKTNTGTHISQYLNYLINLDVKVVSITFHEKEGHLKGLPREQIRDIVQMVPKSIEKIIFAGGISTVDDLDYLWQFNRVIPQIGSAIWENRLSISDVYNAMISFNEKGLIPAIIQDEQGQVKGLVHMDREAINRTCEDRILYYYSNKDKRVVLKGESSGNIQKVLKMSLDNNDSNSILVTVDSQKPFCQSGNYSCFSLQTSIKANFMTLSDHIRSKIGSSSYTGLMQQNPGLPLAKLMEEFWEVVCASEETQVSECSDLLVHLLMYLNGRGIPLEKIMNELNARRWDPKLLSDESINEQKKKSNKTVLAITTAKYTNKTDTFAENVLGFRIKRGSGRNLKLGYDILDIMKYQQYFGSTELILVPSRPKDMVWLMAFGKIDGVLTYNTVVENHPAVFKTIVEVPDEDIRLCLIKRVNDELDYSMFSKNNKLLIACEHPFHVHNRLVKVLNENSFSFDKIVGSSEGYLVNSVKGEYHLCDAIVETGKTLEENNLEVFDTVLDHGEVKIGLYFDIRK